MISFIKELCFLNMKICLASRPEPPFPDAWSGTPGFKMHRLNKPGIRAFTSQTLNDVVSRIQYARADLEALIDRITELSQGVFLWARFAVSQMITGLTHGEEIDTTLLWHRLDDMPRELEQIYSRIIQNSSPRARSLSTVILALVTSAYDTLTIEQIHFIISKLPPCMDDVIGPTNVTGFETPASFKRRVLAATGGLTETLPGVAVNLVQRPLKDDHPFPYYSREMEEWFAQAPQCTILRLVHRTVKAYLDSKGGWDELTGGRFYTSLPHEIWMRAGIMTIKANTTVITNATRMERRDRRMFFSYPALAVKENSSNSDDLETTQTMERGPASLPSQGEDISLPNPGEDIHLALSYSIRNVPHHALNFETLSGKPSYDILRDGLSNTVANAHYDAFGPFATCACFPGSFYGAPISAFTDMSLMIGHTLLLCLKEYLEKEGEQNLFRDSLPQEWYGFTHVGQILDHLQSSNARSPLKKDFVRQCALYDAFHDPYLGGAVPKALKLALAHSEAVTDEEVLVAIHSAPLAVAKRVLQCLPGPGTLLKSSIEWYTVKHKELLPKSLKSISVGLLWAAGKRDGPQVRSLIELLLKGGEDINALCGPFGTILHSMVDGIVERFHVRAGRLLPYLEFLLEKGVDINVPGPYGNVLEFFWRLVNTSHSRSYKDISSRREIICRLIHAGAVNNLPDPNGIVPTVDFMKNWANSKEDFYECLYFYQHGSRISYPETLEWHRGESSEDANAHGMDYPEANALLVHSGGIDSRTLQLHY